MNTLYVYDLCGSVYVSLDLTNCILVFKSSNKLIFSYLPVFLWKDKMKKEWKDVFVEMLKMMAKRQNEVSHIMKKEIPEQNKENEDEQEEEEEEMNWCYFCNRDFRSRQAANVHMRTCKDK